MSPRRALIKLREQFALRREKALRKLLSEGIKDWDEYLAERTKYLEADKSYKTIQQTISELTDDLDD